MGTDIPQRTVEMVIDALCEGDKEGALFLYYRASNRDLDDAWSAVQQLLVDLGSGHEDLPSKTTQDPTYHSVKYYVTTDTTTRRKAIIRSCVIALALICVAAYVLILHSTRIFTSLRSFSWPSTEATVVKARTYSEGRRAQQRDV